MESIKKSNERVLNTFENSVVNDLVENLNNSDSQDEYVTFLDEKLKEYAESSLTVSEKESAMTNIAVFGAYVQYMSENSDLVAPNNRTGLKVMGWWKDWGKCTVGSVLVGTASGLVAASLEVASLGTATPVVIGILIAAGTWMIEC